MEVLSLAIGDVASYVGHSDIVMMPSVVDVSGLNTVLKTVLSNAAGAMHGGPLKQRATMSP
jgi:uncharacterized protein (UPF0261 family)